MCYTHHPDSIGLGARGFGSWQKMVLLLPEALGGTLTHLSEKPPGFRYSR